MNPACWIHSVVSVTVKMAPRCTTPPALPLVMTLQVTLPGEGQTLRVAQQIHVTVSATLWVNVQPGFNWSQRLSS